MRRRDWLDRKTRALLEGTPPPERVATSTGEYSLLLIELGEGVDRLLRAVERVRHAGKEDAVRMLGEPLPLVIGSGLTLADAMLGQFELVCCDATAIFLRDEVACKGAPGYLRGVLSKLKLSPEFTRRSVQVRSVPAGEDGRRFLDQFLGSAARDPPLRVEVPGKKARIMLHWAARIGAEVVAD
jgi:hypothetical protein